MDKNTKYFMLIAAAAVAITAALCIAAVDQTNFPDADADLQDGSAVAVSLSGDISDGEISGDCGDDLTFTFADNTLIISGSGAMYDYDTGEAPWNDCSEYIVEVVLPDRLMSIGDWAFFQCTSLTSVTIPDSVTSIGVGAFAYCMSLTLMTIPDSVTEIGDNAFALCIGMQEVNVDPANNYYSSENGILYDKEKTVFVYCPGSYTSTSVTIPDSVTSIGVRAFAYCMSLTSVTIPDSVTEIGDDAFIYCESLTSMTIPDSVTSIGSYVFYGCTSLTSVVIPDSVTSIANYAFSCCSSLTSVTIPDSVTEIGDDAFIYCESLTSVTIPDSVTSIGYEAFYGCSSLTSVTIGSSVTSIGDDAFCDCPIMEVYDRSDLNITPGQYGLPEDAEIIRSDV